MQKEKKAEDLAVQILKYSRNELLVALRFMDLALCKLPWKAEKTERTASDGTSFYFNPLYVFQLYKEGSAELNHAYLHTIFHCIFYHPFVNKGVVQPLWDLACDIAVEAIMNELSMKQIEMPNDAVVRRELDELKKTYGKLTAERLYRKFLDGGLTDAEFLRLNRLFCSDEHFVWYEEEPPESQISKSGSSRDGQSGGQSDGQSDAQAAEASDFYVLSSGLSPNESAYSEWKAISERVKIDLQTASKEWGDRSANLLQNITEVNRETYDYSDFLRKFAVLGEEIQVNDDEFDYIFYTYGLQLYKNVPLVEPLEYKEVRKVKEFVIAIDTSGSVQGELVEKFLTKTYNILMQQESFFTKINVHIIQCDAEIKQDSKITSKEEFEKFIGEIQLRGFGGTDFRPVFDYVEQLIHDGEFLNLKGMIYFTDGYGTFPERKPDFDTAFVFIDDEYGQPQIPVWAIKLVLASDEI